MKSRCLEAPRNVRRPLLALSLVASIGVLPPAARAQQGAPAGGILSFTFENDTFAGTDRYYTAGVRLGWQSTSGAPKPLAALGRVLSPVLLPDAPVQWGLGLSESIFTARRTTLHDPPRDDRPYAGVLLGALSLSAMDADGLGSVELSLGVIGSNSGAEQLQNGVHELIRVGKAKGWSHQISSRPAGMLSLERRWALDAPLGDSGLAVGIVPAAGLNLGNVQSSAAAGLLARFGHGLSMDFGPPRIRPALSGLGVYRAPSGLAWYAFVGLEGRAIAYDATLDGNDHGYWKVEKEPLLAEFPIGVELAYARARLSVSGVWQTKSFEEQPRSPFAYGSISLSIQY
jgi:hypothetical protein